MTYSEGWCLKMSKETITLKVDENKEQFEKLALLLGLLKIEHKWIYQETESMSGHKSTDVSLVINYDMLEVYRKLNRSTGRKKKGIAPGVARVSKIKKEIEESTAEEVAQRLGISRSTLFRRLKKAEENGDNIFW